MNPERAYALILAAGQAVERARYLILSLPGGRWGRLIVSTAVATLVLLASAKVLASWPAAVIALLGIRGIPPLLRGTGRRLQVAHLRRQVRTLTAAARCAHGPATFTSWAQWPVDARTRHAVESVRRINADAEIVIGRIDADGRVLGLFGRLPLPLVRVDAFVPRPRMRLDIILVRDSVLIRKDFRGDEVRFLREWRALAALHGKANVPAIHHVDERRCRLYKNLILGRTVAEIMVQRGARISYLQTTADPAVRRLDPVARSEAVAARARPFLRACFSDGFFQELQAQIKAMHAGGVTGMSPTFQNIVVDSTTGQPWLIDFEDARRHANRSSLAFRFGQYRDRARLRSRFGDQEGTDRLTTAALAWRHP